MKTACRLLSMIIFGGISMAGNHFAYGLPADHYATNSVLAEGRWARVEVKSTGMHLITDAELRKLGFNDPSKVKVYGRGGRQCSPGYTSATHDDLPLQPSVRTKKGIVFFGADHIEWKGGTKDTPYSHDIHAYSHDNYYFLSDREPGEVKDFTAPGITAGGGDITTTFTARLLHEKEEEFGGESGRQIYGEDFRTKRSQNFEFKRTGAADAENMINVRFAAKTTNGQSSLMFKANGQQLPSTANDKISSPPKSEYYYMPVVTSKKFDSADENITLTIDYTQSGTLFFARLDYIELFYNRKLSLQDGELHFYGTFSPAQTLSLSGCTANTVIWDVTDPAAVKEVKYSLTDGNARFGIDKSGYREFIAFEPEDISRTTMSPEAVANQDLHSLPTPDMLIITLPEYREGAERIARLHEEADNMRVHVLDAQAIYNEFSGGKPDVGAFRNILKMWYDRGEDEEGHSIGYCLLMGRPFYDNKLVSAAAKNLGYTPLPIYESYSGNYEHASFSTDDFIGHLEDVDDDKYNISSSKLMVAIGRLPVTNSTEALRMAEKIEKYVKNPDLGSWRNKVMIIADDEDSNSHFNQAQSVYQHMRTNGCGGNHVYDRVYLDSYKRVMTGIGATYPQATERMLRNYNEGVVFTNYIGHGSNVGWCHEHLWTWDQIIAMSNERLTFILSATCRFAPIDEAAISAAEKLLLNPTAGAIGLISTLRTTFVAQNGDLNNAISSMLFRYDSEGKTKRFGDIYKDGKNGFINDNSLRYIFLGDPAIRMPGSGSKIRFSSINGTDLLEREPVMPELPALSAATVEGFIALPDGTVDTGFNGNITLDLYDSERVITTYGNGNGIVTSYNDRDKRLSSTTLKVTDGYWSGVIRVPPEIQGNYTPAMIAGYAWTDDGLECSGTTENLYVYGFNDSGDSDTEAPVIEDLYLNSPNFNNGGLVNSNPILFARITDESGINISDSGIGHAMTLTIDETDVRNDLNSYYTPDPENPGTGYLRYPIENLSAGKHDLTLTVWDNANNVAKAMLEANVGVSIDPVIYDITANVNDTYVDFQITLDRPNTSMLCELCVFDLNGRRIWSEEQTLSSGMESKITSRWNMTDASGTRVPRGIYIYRVNVETPEGTYTTKSKKIAIGAAK